MRSLLIVLALIGTAAAAPRLHITDPGIVHGDVFDLRGYLQIHASELEGRAAELDPYVVGNRLGFMLFDDNEVFVGAAIVTRGTKAYDVTTQRIAFGEAAAVKRFVGSRLTVTASYGHGVPRDCAMGGHHCIPEPVSHTTRSIVATADNVFAQITFRTIVGAPRLAVCVYVDLPSAAVEREGFEIIGMTANGFPALFDATTGKRLGRGPDHCIQD